MRLESRSVSVLVPGLVEKDKVSTHAPTFDNDHTFLTPFAVDPSNPLTGQKLLPPSPLLTSGAYSAISTIISLLVSWIGFRL